MSIGTHRPESLLRAAARPAPPADLAVLARPGAAHSFAAFLAVALEQGVDGVALDFRLVTAPWDFSLDDIQAPVHIWHGEHDRNAPIAAAHWLHHHLRDSQLETRPEDGHASMMTNHGAEILAGIAHR